MSDIFKDEHYLARGIITRASGVAMQNVVAHLSKTPGSVRHAGRPFGADTEAILGGLRRAKPIDGKA